MASHAVPSLLFSILPSLEFSVLILSKSSATVTVNLGEAVINSLFANSPGVVKYVINGNTHSYYRRITGTTGFSLYSNLANTWSSANNVLNQVSTNVPGL